MNLERLILIELNQRKTNTVIPHLYVESKKSQTHINSRMGVVRDWRGWEKGEILVKGYKHLVIR